MKSTHKSDAFNTNKTKQRKQTEGVESRFIVINWNKRNSLNTLGKGMTDQTCALSPNLRLTLEPGPAERVAFANPVWDCSIDFRDTFISFQLV